MGGGLENGGRRIGERYREWVNEDFNGKLRDELPGREIFCTPGEAKMPIEAWRKQHDGFRLHRSLGYCPPAPAAIEAE